MIALVRRFLSDPVVVYLWLGVTLAGVVVAVVTGSPVWAVAAWVGGGIVAIIVAVTRSLRRR